MGPGAAAFSTGDWWSDFPLYLAILENAWAASSSLPRDKSHRGDSVAANIGKINKTNGNEVFYLVL